MTEYDDVEMVAEECFEITGKLLDPDYNVRVNEYGNGFNIIEPAKRLFDGAPTAASTGGRVPARLCDHGGPVPWFRRVR